MKWYSTDTCLFQCDCMFAQEPNHFHHSCPPSSRQSTIPKLHLLTPPSLLDASTWRCTTSQPLCDSPLVLCDSLVLHTGQLENLQIPSQSSHVIRLLCSMTYDMRSFFIASNWCLRQCFLSSFVPFVLTLLVFASSKIRMDHEQTQNMLPSCTVTCVYMRTRALMTIKIVLRERNQVKRFY